MAGQAASELVRLVSALDSRVVFEVDTLRPDGLGGRLRACLAVKVDAETIEAVERDYPADWNAAEAAADLLRIYRDTPYTATRGE